MGADQDHLRGREKPHTAVKAFGEVCEGVVKSEGDTTKAGNIVILITQLALM